MTETKLSTAITLDMLRWAGACSEQRTKFAEIFPNGVTVSIALAKRFAHTFDFVWAAQHLLSRQAQEAYYAVKLPAWEAYNAAVRQAQEAYNAAVRPAWEEYKTACAVAFAEAVIAHGLDIAGGF